MYLFIPFNTSLLNSYTPRERDQKGNHHHSKVGSVDYA